MTPDSLATLLSSAPPYPRRIVCLTEETTEILYRIGAGDLVVGVSGYTVRPPEARRKPKISSFLTARHDEILALRPDLVLAFSDLQADLAAELVRRGVPVHVFNQRSVAEILQTIRVVGALVGRGEDSAKLADEMTANLRRHANSAAALPRRPRVFFEEWHEPLISGIRWTSELVEIVGGDDVCSETRASQGAKGRIVDPLEVARRDPEVVIASWCGRKASRNAIVARPGWAGVAAVRNDQLYEIKSTFILQPGPAALTDGIDQLARIVAAAARGEKLREDAKASFAGPTFPRYSSDMAPTPRRPSRPGRPTASSARRNSAPQNDVPEGEEGEFEEAPPPPQGPSITMMVGLGAALLFAVLLGYMVLSKRGFVFEVENMSDAPIHAVEFKVNGESHKLGDMRPNSVSRMQVKCSPGNDIEVTYGVPARGKFTKKLPKKDTEGRPLELDFTEYKGTCRIRLVPEGIKEFLY